MEDELNDFYKNLQNELEGKLLELSNAFALKISTIAMSVNKEDLKPFFANIDTRYLQAVFMNSYKSEHYEVCQVIKDELEIRGKSPTSI